MKRIVVVDDCKLSLAIARDIIMNAGHEAITVQTGMAANEYIYRPPRPDLILVDVEMPMVNGDRFVRVIKAEQCLHGIPVILMSQKGEEEMTELCKGCGADGFILKPLRTPMLLQLLSDHT